MNFYMAWILFAFIIPNSYGNKKIFKLPKNLKDCKDDASRSMEQEFECILAVLKRMEGVLETYTYWSLREEDFVDDSEDDIWVGCAVSDPFKQDPHICIFPSGRWANPEEFAIGPFTFHTFTESKPWYESIFALFVDNTYNSWTVNPHEKYLKTPSNFISLCMFNLYGANLQEPWKDLATFDTGFWGPVTRSWKRYYGQVSSNCHFTTCDPNIYIEFDDKDVQNVGTSDDIANVRHCSGYYVIDYIPLKTRLYGENCGRPAYRHVYSSCYIRFYRLSDSESCLDSKKLIVALHSGDDAEVNIYPQNNESTYKTFLDNAMLKFETKNVEYGHENVPEQTEYKSWVCLKQVWAQSKHEWTSKNKMLIKGDIFTGKKHKKFRPPCGTHHKESENFDIDYGQQPWVVYLDIGQEKMPCTGTVLSPRHVITVASCICDPHDISYNIWRGSNVNACIDKATRTANDPRRMHYGGSREFKELTIRPPYKSPSGRLVKPKSFEVLWVTLHPNYDPHTREYNIAILGTIQAMQFSYFFYPICLPDPKRMDFMHVSKGTILYSLKALQKMKNTNKQYTNLFNHVKHGECTNECSSEMDKVWSWTNLCHEFHQQFESKHKKIFPNEFMERMASVDIRYRLKENISLVEHCTGVDVKKPPLDSQNREGKCTVKKPNLDIEHYVKDDTPSSEFSGYCDDSNKLSPFVNEKLPLYETLTTIVHNKDCNLPIDTKTRICTAYVPRTPTTYILMDKETKYKKNGTSYEHEVIGYLHGAYRSYYPRMKERLLKKKFDRYGSPIYSEDDVLPHYGFPPKLGVCHPHLIDVGAPSYIRKVSMDPKTGAPNYNGTGTAILISLQSGRRQYDGKICNLQSGFYTDEEILLTKEILQFIKSEMKQLHYLNYMMDIDENFIPLRVHRVTPSSWMTTTTTTTTINTTPYDPWNGTRFRHIPPGKPMFYEEEYWPNGVNPMHLFNIFPDIPNSSTSPPGILESLLVCQMFLRLSYSFFDIWTINDLSI
ncbi:uncharacterized protein [Lepeophtheirus salmonis]|uniref:uncharacterized protein isoform X2 n=1 Tax=Lepeophtheirus salmonis TaxID=72036 RepID=UPI001AE3FF44|nr:uncharacterized protein LOC121131930 isoform X1 [Lepeophtheirus salmonis]